MGVCQVVGGLPSSWGLSCNSPWFNGPCPHDIAKSARTTWRAVQGRVLQQRDCPGTTSRRKRLAGLSAGRPRAGPGPGLARAGPKGSGPLGRAQRASPFGPGPKGASLWVLFSPLVLCIPRLFGVFPASQRRAVCVSQRGEGQIQAVLSDDVVVWYPKLVNTPLLFLGKSGSFWIIMAPAC